MILEEETFKEFGYHPKDLKPFSHKKIVVKCDDCGKIRIIKKALYRNFCGSCKQKGKRNHRFGKTPSHETKNKIIDGNKGKKRSEEIRLKMHEAQSKRFKKNKPPMLGKHHTEETKKKMSKIHMGLHLGDKSPNWRGGISFEPYCILFNDEFKERVREYFGRCCYICNKNEIENGRKLDVHHVTYNKETCCDDSIPLFVPLCLSCHMKTNAHRKFWKEFFILSLEYLTNNKCYFSKEEMEKQFLK